MSTCVQSPLKGTVHVGHTGEASSPLRYGLSKGTVHVGHTGEASSPLRYGLSKGTVPYPSFELASLSVPCMHRSAFRPIPASCPIPAFLINQPAFNPPPPVPQMAPCRSGELASPVCLVAPVCLAPPVCLASPVCLAPPVCLVPLRRLPYKSTSVQSAPPVPQTAPCRSGGLAPPPIQSLPPIQSPPPVIPLPEKPPVQTQLSPHGKQPPVYISYY